MYQLDNNQSDDEIVIDIDGMLSKGKRYIHRKAWLLGLITIAVCVIFFVGQRVLHRDIYRGYVTYMVNYVGDEGTDAFVASMLGNHLDTLYTYGGLEELLKNGLRNDGSDASWLTKQNVGTSFDSTTNLLTVYAEADSVDRMESLQKAVKDVFPTYAVKRFNDITLVIIDENIDVDPVNQHSVGEILVIGLLLGLFAACLPVIWSIFMNRMIYSKEDMRKITHISYIGEIPRVEQKKYPGKKDGKEVPLSLLKVNKHNQRFAESIRSLRYKILKMLEKENDKVLMVISSISGEGKTVVSINMALAMAESGKKVALLDGDIYRANVRNYLQLKDVEYSLADYLKGDCSTEELIMTGFPMDIIPGDASQKAGSLALSEEKMTSLIAYLREKYDYVIIDIAPTVIRSDAEILSTMADAFVYVVRCDTVEKKMVKKGLASLINKPIHCLGYILNGVDNYSGSYHGKYYKYYQSYE